MADQAGPDAAAPTGRPTLKRGMQVDVLLGLDGTWQSGFTVEEVTETGYHLRRESDGSVLPEIPMERVRRRRTRSTWWI